MRTRTVLCLLSAVIAIVTVLPSDPRAYTTNGTRWNQVPVPYFVNTANMDLAASALETAVRAGADTWAQQSTAAFAFSYAGPSTQTTNTNDGINLVIFRNATSPGGGSAIATTYSWFNNSSLLLLDTDIVFWDGAFQFFAGTTGCATGFYVEDIGAHEFGHALGLGHSTTAAATMFPSTSYCNTSNRVLDADDLAGVLAIYGPRTGPPPTPAAPTGLRVIR